MWQDDGAASGDAAAAAPVVDPWAPQPPRVTAPVTLRAPNRPQIAAVRVDQPGCSFNPDFEHHQDAVAEAVAAELRPAIEAATRPPLAAPALARTSTGDDAEGQVAASGSEAPAMSSDDEERGCAVARTSAARRTRKKAGKAAARHAAEAAAEHKAALKKMRRDIDAAKALTSELDADQRAQAAAQARLRV